MSTIHEQRALLKDSGGSSTLITCPPQLSYNPYVPGKRMTVTPTANAVFIQSSNPQYVAGDDVLQFTLEAAFPSEYQSFSDRFFTTSPVLYRFVGYWNDDYSVYFTSLSPPTVRGRSFDFQGTFRIMKVNSLPSGLTC